MKISLIFLLLTSAVAAQAPPAKQFPHDRVTLSFGKHFNPETTEQIQWVESTVAPSDHFWSRWQDKWALWTITFPSDALVVPNCLYYDLDAPDKVGQIYFPKHDTYGVTAKVRQGHHIEAHCTSVHMKPQIGGTMIGYPSDAEAMKCPANTVKKTRPHDNPALVEAFCEPVKP